MAKVNASSVANQAMERTPTAILGRLTAQPIKEAVNPFISPDSEEQLEERTLDFLRDKVKSLSALKKATV